jgi:oligopeptidase A
LALNNPNTIQHGLPEFSNIDPTQVESNLKSALENNRRAIADLLATLPATPDWSDLIEPLQRLDCQLDNQWSPVRHLNAVRNSEHLRAAYTACLPLLSDYHTELAQSRDLFTAYSRLAASNEFQDASPARKKLVHDALRDFRLQGVDLAETQKARLRQINARLSELTSRYQDNVLDATQAWTLFLPPDTTRLAGLTASGLALLSQNSRQRDLDGYVITLDFPSYHAVMTHADDRSLREEVYAAYSTRASTEGPLAGQYNNDDLMVEILHLREEKAQLTGFSHYAARSLATKMAAEPEQVIDFIMDLTRRARPVAEQELADVRVYARTQLGIDDLQVWDLPYAAERIRSERLGLSQDMLKPYFPAPSVVQGLFTLVERLFEVRIVEDTAVETWHPDVRFFWIHDVPGEQRAGFYLDLYARAQKRGGAWMDVCRSRFATQEGLQQLPIAYMTCNSTPPIDDQPALFTHDEVVTLFHEFGHGLHHMLTRVDYPEIAGISGVEWDAVELPSQFMENWCWEREALDLFARHHETGEALPESLLDRLQGTRHFHTAMQLLRQLEFALFDMRLHSMPAPASAAEIQSVLEEVRSVITLLPPPAYNRFQNGFTHIFAGGYAAGYYSYKWAEVLSADAFARFEEEGLFSTRVGADYLREILEAGASRPAIESFRAFRGRDPSLDALLRHSGLEKAA